MGSACCWRRCLPLLIGLLALAVPVRAQAPPTALEIIQRADDLMRGDTQSGTYTMTIVRPDWERTLAFAFWSEGDEKSFIRVLEPAKERGVAFLKIGREMWQYVPRINRVIKIPPSMMLQSWMGSDFTNDDLVRESSVVDDYTHTLLGIEHLDGAPAYKIELTPKPEAPVAWARLVEWIRTEDFVPLRAEFYNERGENVRTMLYGDLRAMSGRMIPARMELIEETRPGRRTVLVLDDVRFDAPIRSSVFTQQNLRRAQ